MRFSNIVLLLTGIALFASCGAKSESERNVVSGKVSTAVVSLSPEYYFSGICEFGNDTSFMTETFTGRKLGVIGNKVTDCLKNSCDTLFGDVGRVYIKARGYIREVVRKGDIYDCIYLTYVEEITKDWDKALAPVTGEYRGNGICLRIDDDHSCHMEINSDTCDGEWFMSNDTLLYINMDSLSCIFDVYAGNDTIVNHKRSDFILVRE